MVLKPYAQNSSLCLKNPTTDDAQLYTKKSGLSQSVL